MSLLKRVESASRNPLSLSRLLKDRRSRQSIGIPYSVQMSLFVRHCQSSRLQLGAADIAISIGDHLIITNHRTTKIDFIHKFTNHKNMKNIVRVRRQTHNNRNKGLEESCER